MNQLSWPATVLLGILLGMALVAADRPADERTAAEEAGPGRAPGQGAGDAGDADDAEQTNPDTGAAGADANSNYALTLTFDDGPHPTYTPEVLALLEQHDAVAVFCVVGERVREHPELVRQIVEDGHALCNHTYTHDEQLSDRSRATIEQEICDTTDAIESALGHEADVRYFRQPNMYVQPEIMPVLDSLGLEPLDWDIDPRDWSRPGSESIVQGVLSEVRPGAVVLLHDGGGDRSQTVAALEQILDGLDTAGYRYALPDTDQAA